MTSAASGTHTTTPSTPSTQQQHRNGQQQQFVVKSGNGKFAPNSNVHYQSNRSQVIQHLQQQPHNKRIQVVNSKVKTLVPAVRQIVNKQVAPVQARVILPKPTQQSKVLVQQQNQQQPQAQQQQPLQPNPVKPASTEKAPFKCTQCRLTFPTRALLRQHLLSMVHMLPCGWNDCNQHFSNAAALRKHLDTHVALLENDITMTAVMIVRQAAMRGQNGGSGNGVAAEDDNESASNNLNGSAIHRAMAQQQQQYVEDEEEEDEDEDEEGSVDLDEMMMPIGSIKHEYDLDDMEHNFEHHASFANGNGQPDQAAVAVSTAVTKSLLGSQLAMSFVGNGNGKKANNKRLLSHCGV